MFSRAFLIPTNQRQQHPTTPAHHALISRRRTATINGAGSVARQSGDVRAGGQAACKPARDSMAPEWSEGQPAELYNAVRTGHAAAQESGRPASDEAAAILSGSQSFNGAGQSGLKEAARPAELAADGARIRRGGRINLAGRRRRL